MLGPLKRELASGLAGTIRTLYGVEHAPVAEVPPRRALGDLAFPAALHLAKGLGRKPRELAAELAAKARPDGYTLALGSDSLFAVNPHLYAKMPIDPHRDLVPVALVISNQVVLAVNPATAPVNDLGEFVALVRDPTLAGMTTLDLTRSWSRLHLDEVTLDWVAVPAGTSSS